jgi:hypothetical protein
MYYLLVYRANLHWSLYYRDDDVSLVCTSTVCTSYNIVKYTVDVLSICTVHTIQSSRKCIRKVPPANG